MARSKRRTTRSNPQKAREQSPQLEPLSPLSARSSLTPIPVQDEPSTPPGEPPVAPEQPPEEANQIVQDEPVQPVPMASEEDACPACKDLAVDVQSTVSKESWIRCDACKSWYHWVCAGNGEDVDAIDKWQVITIVYCLEHPYCKACVLEKPSRTITFKPPARKSARKRAQPDYANLNAGVEADPSRWLRVIQSKPIKDDEFRRMAGSDVGLEWLGSDENAMKEPIVIENPEGLGMKMPDANFTVSDVADVVGHETPVEVIDVATQSNCPGWTLGRWAEYYNKEPPARDKVRNVISLEISGTPLADRVLPPRLVRELDWVDKFWPSTRRGKGHAYPKVQLYCLMGVASAWTDWHVDFAGSSVYYHILRGCKVFYFIRPTPANLAAYERWSGTELQSNIWLGDMVDEVVKVTIYPGNTMIIPTGWIHAVHTPIDSLVFGGNFLHSYNVATQLKVIDIEKATRVPKKFRFPYFTKYLNYAARTLSRKYELWSAEAKQPNEMQENMFPSDRIKDASALARELRWRVRLSAGTTSDDEELGPPAKKASTNGNTNVNGGAKRKRSPIELQGMQTELALGRVQFRNFQPRGWDTVVDLPIEGETQTVQALYPEGDGWQQRWTKRDVETLGEDAGSQALVERRREITIKIRKVDGGLERQRIERVFEKWKWPGIPDSEVVEKVEMEMKVEEEDPSHQTNVGPQVDNEKKEELPAGDTQEAQSDAMIVVE
ncbi:Clavaminate synthase-like protein [Chiua virens]|nr:Clavaminate synthase-like protein [Chiua virens]